MRGLTKRFGERTVGRPCRHARCARGQIYGFLGPNGSGKTTTIRMLCGLLTPDEGEGTCLGLRHPHARRAAIKREVGYMTQKFQPLRRPVDRREPGLRRAHVRGAATRAAQGATTALDAARAWRAPRPARRARLSGGWKQRLALAACLMHEPQLLLLDEPTAGVDPKARRDFWDQIHELAAAGMTVLVSHALHGRSRALPRAGLHLLRQAAGARHGGRSDRARRPDDLRSQRPRPDRAGARSCATDRASSSVAPFGTALHVRAPTRDALESALAPWRGAQPGDRRESTPAWKTCSSA